MAGARIYGDPGQRRPIRPHPVFVAKRTSGENSALILGAVAAAGAAAFAWGSLVERNRFTVRRERLPILAPGATPIRVLHLSDLHMAPWQRMKQAWIASLVDLEPDLVVNTGDNLGHVDGLLGVRRALEPFAGIPGAYVNGSNDYFGPVLKNPFNYFWAGPRTEHDRQNSTRTLSSPSSTTTSAGRTSTTTRASCASGAPASSYSASTTRIATGTALTCFPARSMTCAKATRSRMPVPATRSPSASRTPPIAASSTRS